MIAAIAAFRFGFRRLVGGMSRIAAAGGIVLALAAAAQAQPAQPQRVVSTALCGDQLLLALAAPEQIASLSRQATDPALSYFAETAARFPHDARTAESVIALRPDLVLVDTATPPSTRAMLAGLGYHVVEVRPVATIDEAIAQVRDIAAILGQPAEGAALAALIITSRDRARRENWGVTAAYYHRRGYVSGETALVTDILRVIGFNNVGPRYALRGGGRLTLEQLVAAPPDYLIVANANPTVMDQGLALLQHPALVELFPPARRIELPEHLTACGGASIVEAIRLLVSEFQRVSPR